jgi:RimJ/RimL family protein N-acetyltransferase
VQLRATHTPIGICGLLQRDTLPSPDIGFAFRPPFWGNGYALESASAVMAFAANVLGVSELYALVSPANVASVRLLGKLGFTRSRLASEGVALYATTLPASPDVE